MSTRITFAMPTNRGVEPETFAAAMALVAENREYEWHIICPSEGYTIAENRNYIATQAVKHDSDYLLMIDDDMIFDSSILDDLLANDKDICGVAYHSRGSSAKIKLVESDIMAIAETEKGQYINLETNTDPKYKDTFECYATGTGIMLIRTKILPSIARPWFEFTYFDNGKCKEGEDWNFCFKAKDAGFKIWCDPKPKIGHLGEKIF